MTTVNYRNSGYDRSARDLYSTPDKYISWLFMHWLPSVTMIYEPCAGEHYMSRQIEACGFDVVCTDIETGQDYLKNPHHWPCIITNPPYGRSLGPKIVRHAIAHTDQCAFLLPFDWDAANKRHDLFSVESSFHMKITCNQRLKWIEGSESSGMHNYAWFVWDIKSKGCEPLLRYAPFSY